MVVNIKHIGGAIVALVLLQGALWMFFDAKIASSKKEFEQNKQMIAKLENLGNKWSKKAQKEELEKALSLLGAFGVAYESKEVRDKRVITMELSKTNVNKVVSLLVNRNIEIVKLKMTKVDEFSILLEVEII